MSKEVKKVVLAYSGGLDTSVILRWLQESYGCEVVTFTADLGQGEEIETARAKAEKMGIAEIHVEDLREEFVGDYVFPMFRANALYEGVYLLGTSIARPLIAKRTTQDEISILCSPLDAPAAGFIAAGRRGPFALAGLAPSVLLPDTAPPSSGPIRTSARRRLGTVRLGTG